MRSTGWLALAALVALPLTATAAGAAPTAASTGNALSRVDTRALVVDVRKGGGGGYRGGYRGGGGGMKAFRGGGGYSAHRSSRSAMNAIRGGGRTAGYRGYRGNRPGIRGGRHWHGGGHKHHRHWRGRRFYPGWYGVPYYYNYGPAYYYDDYDDGYDDAAVYSADAVERCAARYRSFDRATGTFLSNSGERKLCPYLR